MNETSSSAFWEFGGRGGRGGRGGENISRCAPPPPPAIAATGSPFLPLSFPLPPEAGETTRSELSSFHPERAPPSSSSRRRPRAGTGGTEGEWMGRGWREMQQWKTPPEKRSGALFLPPPSLLSLAMVFPFFSSTSSLFSFRPSPPFTLLYCSFYVLVLLLHDKPSQFQSGHFYVPPSPLFYAVAPTTTAQRLSGHRRFVSTVTEAENNASGQEEGKREEKDIDPQLGKFILQRCIKDQRPRTQIILPTFPFPPTVSYRREIGGPIKTPRGIFSLSAP